MPIVSRVSSFWRNLLRRNRVERDLDDEVIATFDLLVDEKVRNGMEPHDARRAATLQLGRVETLKEQVRDARSGALVDGFLWDTRYAARLLRNSPLVTITATLSLAIGIGAPTAIFSIANALLFRAPSGVADPNQLVEIVRTENGRLTLGVPSAPYPDYLEIRHRSTTLSGVYGYELQPQPVGLGGAADAVERVFAGVVTTNYFSVLGVRPAAGRLFGAGDSEEEGVSPIVVLSHGFWTRRFNADPAVVGQTLQLNGHPFIVVGIASKGFLGTTIVSADVWTPVAMAQAIHPGPYSLRNRASTLWIAMAGRLKPGTSATQASAELDAIGWALERESPGGRRFPGARGTSYSVAAATPIPGNIRILVAGFLSLVMGVVLVVLFSACTNVAGVLLARAAARRREIAVRVAIGAGRARLVRQLLTESTLLFVLGGGAGLFLARGMISLLFLVLPGFPVPVDVSIPLDGRVIAFAAGLSLVGAVLSGLAPALHASKTDVVSALKDDSQGPSDRLRLRNAFVVAQVAFSILLVVAAGLFARALTRAGSIDEGFDPHGVESASVDLSMAGYTDTTGPLLVRDLRDRLQRLPGVNGATLAAMPPTSRGGTVLPLTVPGVDPPDGEAFFQALGNVVGPGYFAAMRIPLVAGRDFTNGDSAGAPPVAIVGEGAARQFWPGQDPIGKYVLLRGPSPTESGTSGTPPLGPPGFPRSSSQAMAQVIGVARDLRPVGAGPATVVRDLREPATAGAALPPSVIMPPPFVYVPLLQRYTGKLTILARAADGRRLASEISVLVTAMDPKLPILDSQALDRQSGPIYTQLRIAAAVSGGVGLVGLLLAAMGVYGVTAYTVARRTREIGIRMALGATRAEIIGMILRQGMGLVSAGSAIGLMLAAALSRLLVSLLYGVSPLDPTAFAGAGLLFAAIGLGACYLPARRATRIDAMEALRYE